jgi:limonene-1,2-epoxide hydrolase
MEPIQTAIIGTENQGTLTKPYQTLVQFYDAFNRADMRAMGANWAQSDEVVMDNLLGVITHGWSEIRGGL